MGADGRIDCAVIVLSLSSLDPPVQLIIRTHINSYSTILRKPLRFPRSAARKMIPGHPVHFFFLTGHATAGGNVFSLFMVFLWFSFLLLSLGPNPLPCERSELHTPRTRTNPTFQRSNCPRHTNLNIFYFMSCSCRKRQALPQKHALPSYPSSRGNRV